MKNIPIPKLAFVLGSALAVALLVSLLVSLLPAADLADGALIFAVAFAGGLLAFWSYTLRNWRTIEAYVKAPDRRLLRKLVLGDRRREGE